MMRQAARSNRPGLFEAGNRELPVPIGVLHGAIDNDATVRTLGIPDQQPSHERYGQERHQQTDRVAPQHGGDDGSYGLAAK